MIIDIHAHLLAQTTLDALASRQSEFANVTLIEDDEKVQLAFSNHAPTRPIMRNLRDAEARREWREREGIDLQLAGGWLDSFGYELPDDEGARWCEFLNTQMMATAKAEPGLLPLATVPLQNGELAAAVLRDAVALGIPGAMIGTYPHGSHGNLDDPDLDPFWCTATELGVPIMIHPMFVSGDERLQSYQMVNAVGRVTDVSVAISRLLFSGHLLRFDGLNVIASTGGGALPWMLGRLEQNYRVHPGQFADPVASFHKLYFDSIVFRSKTLRFLIDLVGVDRVMLGSDYPFPIGDLSPREILKKGDFSNKDIVAVCTDNAKRLFGL